MRLDKYLADMGIGTRSDLKKAIRSGAVSVNGETVKQADVKVQADDSIVYQGEKISYHEYEYICINKPAGVLSARDDPHQPTVLDLLPGAGIRKDIAPVGRLDKDAEGLLLLTNDGKLAHSLLTPDRHIPKRYLVNLSKPAEDADKTVFAEGVFVPEDPTAGNERGRESFTARPSKLFLPGKDHPELKETEAIVEVTEGRFHQVKRMFAARGKTVLYLKRISMGPLILDGNLAPGEWRELTKGEISKLLSLKNG